MAFRFLGPALSGGLAGYVQTQEEMRQRRLAEEMAQRQQALQEEQTAASMADAAARRRLAREQFRFQQQQGAAELALRAMPTPDKSSPQVNPEVLRAFRALYKQYFGIDLPDVVTYADLDRFNDAVAARANSLRTDATINPPTVGDILGTPSPQPPLTTGGVIGTPGAPPGAPRPGTGIGTGTPAPNAPAGAPALPAPPPAPTPPPSLPTRNPAGPRQQTTITPTDSAMMSMGIPPIGLFMRMHQPVVSAGQGSQGSMTSSPATAQTNMPPPTAPTPPAPAVPQMMPTPGPRAGVRLNPDTARRDSLIAEYAGGIANADRRVKVAEALRMDYGIDGAVLENVLGLSRQGQWPPQGGWTPGQPLPVAQPPTYGAPSPLPSPPAAGAPAAGTQPPVSRELPPFTPPSPSGVYLPGETITGTTPSLSAMPPEITAQAEAFGRSNNLPADMAVSVWRLVLDAREQSGPERTMPVILGVDEQNAPILLRDENGAPMLFDQETAGHLQSAITTMTGRNKRRTVTVWSPNPFPGSQVGGQWHMGTELVPYYVGQMTLGENEALPYRVWDISDAPAWRTRPGNSGQRMIPLHQYEQEWQDFDNTSRERGEQRAQNADRRAAQDQNLQLQAFNERRASMTTAQQQTLDRMNALFKDFTEEEVSTSTGRRTGRRIWRTDAAAVAARRQYDAMAATLPAAPTQAAAGAQPAAARPRLNDPGNREYVAQLTRRMLGAVPNNQRNRRVDWIMGRIWPEIQREHPQWERAAVYDIVHEVVVGRYR